MMGLAQLSVAQDIRKEQTDASLKILLVSDLNDSYGSLTYSAEVHDVVSRIKDIKPDIILCGGDMVAGQLSSLTVEQLNAMWAGFRQSVLEPINAHGVPFGFTMGNHDASPNFHNDRAAAKTFWLANKENVHLTFVDDTHFPYYFSYLKNNVFFVSWDASSAIIPDSVKTWMAGQLSDSLAVGARGRIVLGHLPLYAIVESKNKPGEVLDNADETLAFFQFHRVDMYISGHQHAYYPAKKEHVALLHSGCLGGGPRQLLGHTDAPYKSYVLIEIPENKGIQKAIITGIEADGHQSIPLQTLPESITGFNGTVWRMDVEP